MYFQRAYLLFKLKFVFALSKDKTKIQFVKNMIKKMYTCCCWCIYQDQM